MAPVSPLNSDTGLDASAEVSLLTPAPFRFHFHMWFSEEKKVQRIACVDVCPGNLKYYT